MVPRATSRPLGLWSLPVRPHFPLYVRNLLVPSCPFLAKCTPFLSLLHHIFVVAFIPFPKYEFMLSIVSTLLGRKWILILFSLVQMSPHRISIASRASCPSSGVCTFSYKNARLVRSNVYHAFLLRYAPLLIVSSSSFPKSDARVVAMV